MSVSVPCAAYLAGLHTKRAILFLVNLTLIVQIVREQPLHEQKGNARKGVPVQPRAGQGSEGGNLGRERGRREPWGLGFVSAETQNSLSLHYIGSGEENLVRWECVAFAALT
ncbi:hypothetical protein KC19_7G002700 [Ceratodon purpureus]|uniref:Secreted protein n=1 Tax=Ceratodon purpureus TaxID=3225 RepID=A0A8T0H0K0_CERPU|nr:hypothetical protein KC19_7G002700 [Ceratodon purpureus]